MNLYLSRAELYTFRRLAETSVQGVEVKWTRDRDSCETVGWKFAALSGLERFVR